MLLPKNIIRRGLIMGFVLGSLLASSPSFAVSCGDTIGPNEAAILTENLICPGDNPTLTLQGPGAVLNMFGHSVDCVDPATNVGILMTGSGSILQAGKVKNCLFGVHVDGDGGHIVQAIKAKDNQIGFEITSNNNEVNNSTSTQSMFAGFAIRAGQGNSLKENFSKNNGGDGFTLNPAGSDHTLYKNKSISNNAHGYFVSGQRISVTENLAKDNGQVGVNPGFRFLSQFSDVFSNKSIRNNGDGFRFQSGSNGNTALSNISKKNNPFGIVVENGAINHTLLGNIALRNSVEDLRDTNVNCDNNTWGGNLFQTTNNPACIQ